VNSFQATQFRIWATRTLKEFITKGFALDDERLKQGTKVFGKDYFDELLERIREIRASERRSYQKITDIIAAFVELAQLSGPVPGVLAGPAFRAADGGLDLGALAGELEDVTLAPSL
jgi:hypothetical protein